jgi:hypothetical protein
MGWAGMERIKIEDAKATVALSVVCQALRCVNDAGDRATSAQPRDSFKVTYTTHRGIA